jgi:hypothetical protein
LMYIITSNGHGNCFYPHLTGPEDAVMRGAGLQQYGVVYCSPSFFASASIVKT